MQLQTASKQRAKIKMALQGPSGSGKTVLLQNMILDLYNNCFSRIYIFLVLL